MVAHVEYDIYVRDERDCRRSIDGAGIRFQGVVDTAAAAAEFRILSLCSQHFELTRYLDRESWCKKMIGVTSPTMTYESARFLSLGSL